MRPVHDDAPRGDTEEAWRVLDLVNGWLRHAEAKAGVALASAGVLGGLLYSLVGELTSPHWWIAVPTVVAVGAIIAAGICGSIAVMPRLFRNEPPMSKIYYDHIARRYPRGAKTAPAKLLAFQKALAKTTEGDNELFDDLSAQVWANAHVARAKYKWSGRAIVFVIAGAASVALTAVGVAWQSL